MSAMKLLNINVKYSTTLNVAMITNLLTYLLLVTVIHCDFSGKLILCVSKGSFLMNKLVHKNILRFCVFYHLIKIHNQQRQV